MSVLLYRCETWNLTKCEEERIDKFQTKCIDKMFKIRWQRHIANKTAMEMIRTERMCGEVWIRKWNWIGHVIRKNKSDDCAVALGWRPEGKRGHPKTTWRMMVERDSAGWKTWDAARRTALGQ